MGYRVLVLVDREFQMPEDIDQVDQKWLIDWKTEYDVITALEELGHEIQIMGGVTELGILREGLSSWKPHIVFNLLEEFFGQNFYVPYLLGFFELIRQPFTGCSPSSMLLASNKPLAKQILVYHRIPMPHFKVFFPAPRRVASWTGQYAYTINLVLKDMIQRSRELQLRVTRPEKEIKLEAAILLTMQTMNYLHSKRHHFAV